MSNNMSAGACTVRDQQRSGNTSAWQNSLRGPVARAQKAALALPAEPPNAAHKRVTSAQLWAYQAGAKAQRSPPAPSAAPAKASAAPASAAAREPRVEDLLQQLAKIRAEAEANRQAAEEARAREAKACARVAALRCEVRALREGSARGSGEQAGGACDRAVAAARAAQRRAEEQLSASEDMVAALSQTILDFETSVASLQAQCEAQLEVNRQQAAELSALESALGLEVFANFLRAAAMAAELRRAWQEAEACRATAAAACTASMATDACVVAGVTNTSGPDSLQRADKEGSLGEWRVAPPPAAVQHGEVQDFASAPLTPPRSQRSQRRLGRAEGGTGAELPQAHWADPNAVGHAAAAISAGMAAHHDLNMVTATCSPCSEQGAPQLGNPMPRRLSGPHAAVRMCTDSDGTALQPEVEAHRAPRDSTSSASSTGASSGSSSARVLVLLSSPLASGGLAEEDEREGTGGGTGFEGLTGWLPPSCARSGLDF